MTSTDNPDQTPSAVKRHDRALLDMLWAHDIQIAELLGPTDHLDPDLKYDLGAALQNIDFSHLQIGWNEDPVHYRQRCLGHRSELDQLLGAAGIAPDIQHKIREVLDDQARAAEHFRRTAPVTT